MRLTHQISKLVGLTLLAAGAHSVSVASTITKTPDLGPYWTPLSSNGTYVYANSFVAGSSGGVQSLGTWLIHGGSDLRFQVYGSLGGNPTGGPDTAHVYASTNTIGGQIYGGLTYVDGGAISNFEDLVAGSTYWFAASTVGLGGNGYYTLGGHTQNSGGITDNGTFWFSNDIAGLTFDGRSIPQEIAFSVDIGSGTAVPEPASIALIGFGLLGVVAARRKLGK